MKIDISSLDLDTSYLNYRKLLEEAEPGFKGATKRHWNTLDEWSRKATIYALTVAAENKRRKQNEN